MPTSYEKVSPKSTDKADKEAAAKKIDDAARANEKRSKADDLDDDVEERNEKIERDQKVAREADAEGRGGKGAKGAKSAEDEEAENAINVDADGKRLVRSNQGVDKSGPSLSSQPGPHGENG